MLAMENPQLKGKRFDAMHEIAAYISGKACAKVHTVVQKFPRMLRSEMVLRREIWPKKFTIEPPICFDIALCFIPEKRDEQLFETCLAHVNDQDLGIKVLVDYEELLIFSSLQLPPEHQKFHGKFYLWGVFRSNQSNVCHPLDLDAVPPPIDAGAEEGDHIVISKNATSSSLPPRDAWQIHERRTKVNIDQITPPSYLADAMEDPAPEFITPALGKGIVKRNPERQETDLSEQNTENLYLVQSEDQPNHIVSTTSSSLSILLAALVELDEIDKMISTKLCASQGIAGMGIKIGRYTLNPSMAHILRSIIDEYGDIAKCSPLPDCTNVLEKICDVVKNFQVVPYKKLKEHHLDSLNTIIIEARRANIDVDWLQNHLYKLRQIFLMRKEFPSMKQKVHKKIKEAESMEGALMLMEDDSDRQALKSQLNTTVSEIERMNAEICYIVTKWKDVREKFLIEVCEICGSVGFSNALVNCVNYCLDQLPEFFGDDNIIWTCEDCLKEAESCSPVNPIFDSNRSGLACRSYHVHAKSDQRHNSVPIQPTTYVISDIVKQSDYLPSLPIRGQIWRDERVYRELLRDMVNRNHVMKAVIGDTDLLVFSPVQLPEQCQRERNERFVGKCYLWGVFKGQLATSFCKREDSFVSSDSKHPVETGKDGSLIKISAAERPRRSPVRGEWWASVSLILKEQSVIAGKIGEGLVGINNHTVKLPSADVEKLENASSVSDENLDREGSSSMQHGKLQKELLIADVLGDEVLKECYHGRKKLKFDSTSEPDGPLIHSEEPVAEHSPRGTSTGVVADKKTYHEEEDAAAERATIIHSILERVNDVKHATAKTFKSIDFQEEPVQQTSIAHDNGGGVSSSKSHCNSESICKSVLNMAYAFHEETNVDEAHSVVDSISHVGPYSVDSSLAPMLEDIIGKYGDIAGDCIFQSNSLRSSQLQGLCMAIKKLKEIPFNQIRLHDLNTFEDTITTAEAFNLDVSWLCCRHEELKKTIHVIMRDYNCNTKNTWAATRASLQCTNRILDQKKAQLRKLQAELQLMETRLERSSAEIATIDSQMENVKSRCKQFH